MKKLLRALTFIGISTIFFVYENISFCSDELTETKNEPNRKRKLAKSLEDDVKKFLENDDVISSSKAKKRKVSQTSNEAFLDKDLPSLTQAPLSSDQYQCNDSQFDKVFPLCNKNSLNAAVGQIKTDSGKLGTGTIFEISKMDGNPKKIKIKGITAKHVLFDNDVPKFGQFSQGSIGIDGGQISSLCKYNIKKIFTHQTSADKDIAIFEARSKKELQENEIKALLKIKISNFVKTPSSSKNALIYHYPMGVQEQRKNTGTIDSDTSHLITTLPGSSGASVLNKQKKIIGIHVASGNQTSKKVKYEGDKLVSLKGQEFSVSDDNSYISVIKSNLKDFTVEHTK